MPCYHINQFLVDSTLPLPCPCAALPNTLPSVEPLTVRYVPHTLHEFAYVRYIGRRQGGEYLRAYDVEEGVLVCAGGDVWMLVKDQGSHLFLDFEATDAFAAELASVMTVNLGMSLCTLLRGDIPLHAAGVEVDGRLIGILAPSGTGKSTLLWKLLDAGAVFANDDVLPVKVTREGVLAIPSVSLPAKLSKQTLEQRGIDWRPLQATLPGQEEFWLPIAPECRLLEARPLAALFLLRPFRHPEVPGQITVSRLIGAEALSPLLANTQGLWAVSGKLDAKRLFAQYAALTQAVPLYTLGYHRCVEALPDLVRVMRELLHSGRLPHD